MDNNITVTLILIFSCMFLVSVVYGQDAIITKVNKIPYNPELPISVGKIMPHGAKSCFWGKFRPRANGPSYGLHLYNLHPMSDVNNSQSVSNSPAFVLDIFRVLSTHKYNRINHQTLNYTSRVWDVRKYSAQWTWVYPEPQQQNVLVFKLDIFPLVTAEGFEGNNVFVSYPHGLKERGTVQAFTFGLWRAGGCTGEHNEFVCSNDGRTGLFISFEPDTGELTTEQIKADWQCTLQWDANSGKFWPSAQGEHVLKTFLGEIWKTW